jgi:hypothetical protein
MLAALAAARTGAAATVHDIHFLAEHVIESGMDAHYQGLPWPAGPLTPGEWRPAVDLSTAHTQTDFMNLDGSMIAIGAGRGIGQRWGYELFGFAAAMNVGGGRGEAPLGAAFLRDVPLDLPQRAAFMDPRGSLRDDGVGGAVVRERAVTAAHTARITAGALVQRLRVGHFAVDYRLLAGADAGTTGSMEHSNAATFVTPFVGWEQTRPLARRWTWSPRAMLLMPLPPADFRSRLTGPAFDIATPSAAATAKIGDPFVTLGVSLTHRPSGVEVDIGALAAFTLAEKQSHPGIDRAWAAHVAWRKRAR